MRPTTALEAIDIIDLEEVADPPTEPDQREVSPIFGLLAPRPGTATAPAPRRCREQVWTDASPERRAPWPDPAVRRIVAVPVSACRAELPSVVTQLTGTACADWAVDDGLPTMRLRLGTRCRPVTVELTLADWGARRVELRFQLIGVRLPPTRHQYAVAHAFADSLAAALVPPRPRRLGRRPTPQFLRHSVAVFATQRRTNPAPENPAAPRLGRCDVVRQESGVPEVTHTLDLR